MTRKPICLLLFAIAGLTGSLYATPVFTLTPSSGALEGAPGETVGWDLTIESLTEFVVLNNVELDITGVNGVFTPVALQNYFVWGPSPEETKTTVRLATYAIDAAAQPTTAQMGTLTVFYDLYSVSPNDTNFNPDTDILAMNVPLTFGTSVTVTASAVPEPGSLAFMLFGLAPLLVYGIRRRH